jgi:N-methylhydantoinase A
LGLLFADVEHHLVTGFYRRLADVAPADLNVLAEPLFAEARRLLAAEGFPAARQRVMLQADLKHVGQTANLPVLLETFPVTAAGLEKLVRDFSAAHQLSYGYCSENEPIQFAALKVVGQGLSETPRVPERIERDREQAVAMTARKAYFGPELEWLESPVLPRAGLRNSAMQGPLIIEEYDTTTVVRPGWTAQRDSWNNIVIQKNG